MTIKDEITGDVIEWRVTATRRRRLCSREGCKSDARCSYLCVKHLNMPKVYCVVEECKTLARVHGYCYKHSDNKSKMKVNIKVRMYNHLKRPSIKYLGCELEEYYSFLESRFVDGMSWLNYGEWEIDHIIPLSHFNFKKRADRYTCFNFRNTQPLWRTDNRKKSNKIPDNIDQLMETIIEGMKKIKIDETEKK